MGKKKKALLVNTQLLKGDIVNEGGTCVCLCETEAAMMR